jgi:hypothetical protein
MNRVLSSAFGMVLFLATGVALAQDADTCATPKCQNTIAVDAVRNEIAGTCDCAGAPNATRYMRCVKGVANAAVQAGTLPRVCRAAVRQCEQRIGCGRGIRPFRTVQEVFTGSCALSSCHSALARQGGLVLESEDVSYQNLVGEPAVHPEAAAQGMLRVVPGDPDSSFLIRKLKGLGPGDPMPQATTPLSKGTIKLIERWVARGAETTAAECPPADTTARRRARGRGNKKTCNDRPLRTGNFVWKPEPPLETPPLGTGVQLYTPPREVAPGTEWETCYAFRPNWPELAAAAGYPPNTGVVIKDQVYRMHQGSHHLLLYMYFGQQPEVWPEGFFPCFAANCVNDADCPTDAGRFTIPIGGTQVAGTRYEVRYPEGVGIPVLSPNAVLIANLHYTNPFQPAQPIYGESWLNLDFYPPNGFKALLDGIFAINFSDLVVEPYETRTLTDIWQPEGILNGQPADAAVFQLFGHMHKRGQSFQIDVVRGGSCSVTGRACGRDDDCACKPWQNTCTPGQTCVRGPGAEDTQIYYTERWDQAPVTDFVKPYLLINRNEGLRWTCVHTNGVQGDPTRPPKLCREGCRACGWDATSGTCRFCPTVSRPGLEWSVADQACGFFRRGEFTPVPDAAPRDYQANQPMPLVFGELADDDMCNMFGYFINQDSLPLLP